MFTYLQKEGLYYVNPPCNPPELYPELSSSKWCQCIDTSNGVYALFREVMLKANLDGSHAGTADWNPFGEIVGDARDIVIKPNLVLHHVGELSCTINGLVVNAAVLRPLIDYLLIARKASGRMMNITIADTPIQGADFNAICTSNGLRGMLEHYTVYGIDIPLLDMRYEQAVINDSFMILDKRPLDGDPKGACEIDLGRNSEHCAAGRNNVKYSIQDYDAEITARNHEGGMHKYKFSRTVLDADLVINVSKLKTHAKAGVTLSLKNMIGANVSKDYLPHYIQGGPCDGGDEYPSNSYYKKMVITVRDIFNKYAGAIMAPLHRLLKRSAQMVDRYRNEGIYGGAWYGNDTLWRTIADINKILYYADDKGVMHGSAQRRQVCILDGIVGMEGNGPTKGDDKYAGVIALGTDPVEFDSRLSCLMGFAPDRIPHIACWSGRVSSYVVGNRPEGECDSNSSELNLGFAEPAGWKGRLRR